jgi:hypothetical protein
MLLRDFGPTIRALVGACAVGVLLGLAGCGGGGGGIPVKGKVTVDGKPLAKGSISFHPPKDSPLKDLPTGLIENGEYTIYTKGKPGAPAGNYKVTIVGTDEIDSTNPKATKPSVNPSFGNVGQSKLTAEVSATPKEGAYDYKVNK